MTARRLLPAALILAAACSTGDRAPAEPEVYLVRARGAETIKPSIERPVIQVAPVAVGSHIRGVAVVTENGRVRTLVNQRFAAPIDAFVEETVIDRLRAAGRYGVVLPATHASPAPFTLRLTLRAFEIVVRDWGYEAHVAFDGLVEERDRTIVRSFRATADRPAQGPEGGGFVAGLEEALNAAIDVILTELEAAGVERLARLLPNSG